jgi:hypothetical protein
MRVSPVTEALMYAGLVLAVVLAVGWLLSYTAVRLDRLHHRMHATAAALDAQLVRRAEATLEVALGMHLDPATSTLLAGAATEALETPGAWSAERAAAESQLTEVLRAASAALEGLDDTDEDVVQEVMSRLRGAGVRVQLARRFHNEAVRDVTRLRGSWLVRWFRLAGHAEMAPPVTFDDGWPQIAVD